MKRGREKLTSGSEDGDLDLGGGGGGEGSLSVRDEGRSSKHFDCPVQLASSALSSWHYRTTSQGPWAEGETHGLDGDEKRPTFSDSPAKFDFKIYFTLFRHCQNDKRSPNSMDL